MASCEILFAPFTIGVEPLPALCALFLLLPGQEGRYTFWTCREG